jgi:hypothetical protein
MATKREDLPLLQPLADQPSYQKEEPDEEVGPAILEDTQPDVNAAVSEADADRWYSNFLTMCIAFSVNHGCVVSCLAYSTTELGNSLGGYGSGVLYIFYALTAFFLSKPVVSMIGPKNGLLGKALMTPTRVLHHIRVIVGKH